MRLIAAGNQFVKHHLRAGFAALFALSLVGCGSDEPALKTEMSGADKTAYEAKNRGNIEGGQKKDASATGSGQQSQEYKNATSGGGPGRKPK